MPIEFTMKKVKCQSMLIDEWWEVEFSFKVVIGWFEHVVFEKLNIVLTNFDSKFLSNDNFERHWSSFVRTT